MYLCSHMTSLKPSLARGTRDFGPSEMMKRNYVFDLFKSVFKKYGFQPLETPSMENLGTLTGKYGNEGDRLIFKILNSGDFLSDISTEKFEDAKANNSKGITSALSEKALRYDLTVPLARYVSMNRNGLIMPFKRYQIQPVWRADRPQKGRYREFYQCDADVIGSTSLVNEVELTAIYCEAFLKLGFQKFQVLVNNRKVLMAVAKRAAGENAVSFVTELDKKGKLTDAVLFENLIAISIDKKVTEGLWKLITGEFQYDVLIQKLHDLVLGDEIGEVGIAELTTYFNLLIASTKYVPYVKLDAGLARGLDYYTGLIFEVTTTEVEMGSLGGGGRYDDLTSIFGVSGMTGVGISFGAERIIDVLNQLDRFPDLSSQSTKVLFAWFDEPSFAYALNWLSEVREVEIASEIYPDKAQLGKMFSYADQKNIEWVAVCGENEMKENKVSLKNLKTGIQEIVSKQQLLERLNA